MMMYGQMPLPKKSLGFFRHLRPTLIDNCQFYVKIKFFVDDMQ